MDPTAAQVAGSILIARRPPQSTTQRYDPSNVRPVMNRAGAGHELINVATALDRAGGPATGGRALPIPCASTCWAAAGAFVHASSMRKPATSNRTRDDMGFSLASA